MIIGICGKSGSGKSTLANNIINLSTHETVHLDIDKVGHNVLLLEEVKDALVDAFGANILKENNIDRKTLSQIVFASQEEMQKLTDITWYYMQIMIDKFLSDNQDKIIILDWCLLPKSKYFSACDIKILLDIPYNIRRDRAMKRDNISPRSFALRDSASMNYNQEDFDYILKTNDKKTVKRLVKLI